MRHVTQSILFSDYEQGSGRVDCRSVRLRLRALQKPASVSATGGVHEAHAAEESEQREVDKESEGVVGPHSCRPCPDLETPRQQKIEMTEWNQPASDGLIQL